ncbi:MAG: aldolase [Betaproteobacteria bacterium]|nr:aldolase [Betaproteobacteria bacterium]
MGRIESFRAALTAGAPMMGTFLKTPSAIVCEVLGMSPLACVAIDAEHAPFGRMDIDACIAALRAADMPSLVRVASAAAPDILAALDCGAVGVIAPHIVSAGNARDLAKYCRYGPGGRGYAGSSRSARYSTKSMADHVRDSNASVCVVAQIEDAEALDEIDAIAATPGIDCLFVGRMDLTVSLGASSPKDPIVLDAVHRICDAGKRHGKTVGMFFPPGEQVADWLPHASFFLLGSDQGLLLDGARALAARLDGNAARG